MQWPHVALRGRSVTPNKRHKNLDLLEAASDRAQLATLADTVCEKRELELVELGRQNSEIIEEWFEAFRHEAERARSELEFWSEACEHLDRVASELACSSSDRFRTGMGAREKD